MNGTNGTAGMQQPVTRPAAAVAPAPNAIINAQQHSQDTAKSPAGKVFPFRKAVKHEGRLRLALAGPGGSGKTYSLLELATELGGRIAVVDTEHGSASKYADKFEFDVLELASFDPAIVPGLISAVAIQGYATLIIDSLSHFWMGKDGELDQVDKIAMRSKGNSSRFAWRDVSPKHSRMVDAMLSAPIHVLASLRVKTEWVVEKDDQGKSVPRKVGLQPVMRDGIEYEFDVCADMDQENTMLVTKSRCPGLSGGVFPKPGSEVAVILKAWLEGAPAPQSEVISASAPVPADIEPALPVGVMQVSQPAANTQGSIPPELHKIWRRMSTPRGILSEFEKLSHALMESMGTAAEVEFSRILNAHGVDDPMSFRTPQAARLCAQDLFLRLEGKNADANSAPMERPDGN